MCKRQQLLLTHTPWPTQLDVLQVEAWRARGRVPLGVDITASLLETALCDGSFWAAPAATSAAAAAAGGGGAGAAQHTTAQQQAACRSLSHQQLRLQYAATIVRCAPLAELAAHNHHAVVPGPAKRASCVFTPLDLTSPHLSYMSSLSLLQFYTPPHTVHTQHPTTDTPPRPLFLLSRQDGERHR